MIFDPNRQPDFTQLERVLRKEAPDRPVLLELFLNDRLYRTLPKKLHTGGTWLDHCYNMTAAYCEGGYDYMSMHINGFRYKTAPRAEHAGANTISLNEAAAIIDRATFDAYPWEDPADYGVDVVEAIGRDLPSGMKMILLGPGGILENVIALTGYDNLCMLLYDDPALVSDIFECVGTRMLAYYRLAVDRDFVGAVFSNDDWGFNTQTMLSPADMRKYVFPWHKQIVELAHTYEKYVLLHSCGNYADVIEDVIGMGYDARHSYEDNIQPVEEAYEQLCGRIAVLGGIDIDFMVRSDEDAIYRRCRAMLERSQSRGGYALGTGNSVPEYIPDSHYYAMVKAAIDPM